MVHSANRASFARQSCYLFLGLAGLQAALLIQQSCAAEPVSGGLTHSITAQNLDLEQCRAYSAGQQFPVKKEILWSVLGLQDQVRSWSTPTEQANSDSPSQNSYLIVFKSPIPAGTLEASFAAGNDQSQVRYLPAKAGAGSKSAEQKFDLAGIEKWPSLGLRGVFPPQTTIRALWLTNSTDRGPSELQHCLLYRERLYSLTPRAVGSGEQAPFGSDPDSLPQAQVWRNTGLDSSPGAVQRLQRGAVSTATPSWYILSWDIPQSLSAVILESNADKFQFYSYVGDPRANPALAGSESWKRLAHEEQTAVGLRGDLRPVRRCLKLEPVTTAAIKLEMTSCGGSPIAEISRFDVLQDLKEQAIPSRAADAPSPYAIAYEQPFAGQMAMVIEDQQGRRVRNLLAQVQRKPGQQVEGWDLKDDAGVTVPPGEYRFKVLTAPPLELQFGMTAIPTSPTLAGERTPWQQGVSGPHGWMADHATHTSGIACGDKIYFGAPGVESGVSFIECDLQARKLWAKHSFAGFTGLKQLASDGEAVYIYEQQFLDRMDPQTHEIRRLATLVSPTRKGELTGIAAHKGQVYLSFHGQIPMLENATLPTVVDLEHCVPKYPSEFPDILGNRRVEPNPRMEFLRLLRLAGTPAGQPGSHSATKRDQHFPIYLESSSTSEKHQFICVAFHEPVPLGSVMFPCPAEWKVELFTLKPDAAYPPDPQASDAWKPFDTQPKPGWECLAAPENTLSRGLLVKFTRVQAEADGGDVLDLLAEKKDAPALLDDLDKPSSPADLLGEGKKSSWFGRLEGMKLLRRRFQSLSATASIQVNSGEVNQQGEWDAKRTQPVTPEEPGIYVMEWKSAQQIAGLAIKEIDGAETRIDVWTGAAGSPVTLEDSQNWREVAVYQQARRDSYEPSFERNSDARYLDGYVDFHESISTSAVRLRVVQQWADNGERGTATLRSDRGARGIDARNCRIYGVTALKYLGGEVPADEGVHQRIEVRDGQTGELVRDLAGEVDHSLAFNAKGELFGIQAGQVVQVDTKTGKSQAFLKLGESRASRLTIDSAGNFYVVTQPKNVIEVFDAAGKAVRTIGSPGGQTVGFWDPHKFYQISDLFVDAANSLWVVESQWLPRRIVQYKPDGTLVREFLGNTNYGGAGVLSRYDKTRLFQGDVEYELDWKQGIARIKSLLGQGLPSDAIPVKVDGRLYLASAPLSHQATQPVAIVYLLDDATGKARLVSAFGEAAQFDPLKQGPILKLLEQGKALKDYRFVWSDTSGNGQVDPAEMKLELKTTSNNMQLGRLDDELGCQAGRTRFEVERYLADGTPVYHQLQSSAEGQYRLHNGHTLGLRMNSSHAPNDGEEHHETRVTAADGTKIWSYPTEHEGVSGLWIPPWRPGYVTNEFGVIGHESTSAGDLGEFFVVHANNGQWKVWSADGLLAGNIMFHLQDPRSRSMQAFPSAAPGTRFENLTGGQEHFHSHFTKNEADGRYYVVFGHNYISLLEVQGLDRFKRIEGSIQVSSEDVRRVRNWEAERARRVVKSSAKLISCLALAGGEEVPLSAGLRDITFGMAYDSSTLYVRWRVQGQGPLKNTGTDFQRFFKTGGCVDLQMSTDSKADHGRIRPARGDFRLLITLVDGKPQVVLYQPLAPGADPAEKWETRTDAGGTTSFQRVALLKEVKVSVGGGSEGQPDSFYDLTAAIPLESIGLKIEEGLQLKLDWGVLTTETGDAVRRRVYWSNGLANGTTDEALEARLEPQLWGAVVFHSRSQDEQRLSDLVPNVKGQKSTKQSSDLLKEIEDDLK